MVYTPEPTSRSLHLLLSFPLEVLHMIFDYVLLDTPVQKTLSCSVISLSQVIHCTKGIRGACIVWGNAVRLLVFKDKSLRHGCLLGIRRLLTAKETKTFPMLRDCMVTLCHPYNLHGIQTLQLELAGTTHSLEYVCAVECEVDDPMDMMLGKVQNMGYGNHAEEFVGTFVEECLAAGLKIADSHGKRPNGGDHSDSQRLESSGLRAMKQFFFKEVLALWYYNAQLVRQILGRFPNLEYAVLPDLLHVPLLAKPKYFFPQCEDDSPFAPVSLSPPQMLQNLGIVYKEGGRSYSDIMSSMKVVNVSSMHYPAVLGLFPERFHRLHSGFRPFLIFNRWSTQRGERDFGVEVLHMLKAQMKAALADIPDRRKPTLFTVGELKDALEDA
ncbi:uncharacterized protein BJX67DRAFT_390125 [Aspergillus lucknowensis]|uniref:F-box domain-containing protein n=1 Tax=Aspergillus lucknowensis TaxID=176173 RepID=A0ABR4LIB6_9EURO